MLTISKQERLARLDRVLIREGTALDIGVGGHFGPIYEPRSFTRVEAFNAHAQTTQVVIDNYAYLARPEWHFFTADMRQYDPHDDFDLITMLHVAEHVTLDELSAVLDRLVPRCRHQFIIETPEQFDDNERHVIEENNIYERHLSLVTGDFLNPWHFTPLFNYWQNPRFSNAVFLLSKDTP